MDKWYGSLNNGLRVGQVLNCILLVRRRVYGHVVRIVRLVRVVKQWLTSRTSGALHISSET